ncbi:protein NO VEIN domain-containing protein [Corallococcus sp. AS-1-6]|uniref:protein NO VEIN domain-containing protein n=1 Tax=Corallococcus sp. AS-1-6 TaxID=2874599 RepID=UPI001CBF3A78|nr:DUF3883 domain-containing protein [Corallococcus sp. AS-1-6]MBZ4370068.1 DUF3883 domain-containing protein [Corallococcus sp. AS-1-6]
MSHAAFNDLTPTQYEAAYSWLEALGVLDEAAAGRAGKIALFEAAIAASFWFQDADALVTTAADLPEDARRAAAILGLSPEESLAAIRHASGKADLADRLRIGAAGEHGLIALLASAPMARVRHVSLESDGYGYDVEVTVGGAAFHLEVKSTTRRGRLRVYLSRNEYETMRRDAAWVLVAVRLDPDFQPASIASVDREWIGASAPLDRTPGVRWESVRLDVPTEALIPGIPAVLGTLHQPPLAILAGEPRWPG